MISTNDHAALVPQTEFTEPLLTVDFPGLQIGVAEYVEGPTGCTVFYFPAGAATAIDVRGGSVGKTGDYEWTHAICLAGGSLYGLAAATGVTEELFIRHDHSLENFALVSGAIIFDYGWRDNYIYPDSALGRAALRTARPNLFPLGRRGAGRSASVGGVFDRDRAETSGQAGAFRAVGPTKVAVFSVVNALGVIVDRQGRIVRGNLDATTGERRLPLGEVECRLARGESTSVPVGNTTLSVVVTNQQLSQRALTQLARQVHSSMARIIQPFHTPMDGDVLYAVTMNEAENAALSPVALGIVASELMWDAILTMADIVASEG